MGFGNQMLLVVLALVLFSTITLGIYNSLSNQSTLVGRYMYLTQSFRCADKYLQKVDAESLSKGYTYIWDTYRNASFTESVSNIDYHIIINSAHCDSLGNTANPKDKYQKINIKVWCKPAGYDTIWVGTSSKPISKILANMGV
jgi:hypothetical protein